MPTPHHRTTTTRTRQNRRSRPASLDYSALADRDDHERVSAAVRAVSSATGLPPVTLEVAACGWWFDDHEREAASILYWIVYQSTSADREQLRALFRRGLRFHCDLVAQQIADDPWLISRCHGIALRAGLQCGGTEPAATRSR